MDSYLNNIKESHSKFAIFVWIAYGIYALVVNKLNGIGTLLIYFVAGIFIASLASILTYLLQQLIVKVFVKTHASDSIAVLTSYILFVVEIVWIILVARLFLSFINNI